MMKAKWTLLTLLCAVLLVPVGCEKKPVPERITSKDGAPMILIPGGKFEMGSYSGDADELPVHTVNLDAFYMDAYEVTNAQYKKFMDATGHAAPQFWNHPRVNKPNQPVVGVVWSDVEAYAEWAGKRLPTEAEWEKAARGGLVQKQYPWGDDELDGTQCNFADSNAPDLTEKWADRNADDGYEYTASVGSYTPNGYGLYDMAGNVWEWCANWYETDYTRQAAEEATSTTWGVLHERVLRSGSWDTESYNHRVAMRNHALPSHSSSNVGFRCAQDISP